MTLPRNLALWSCPRSRSTPVSRAFEQNDACQIIDEPFYPPYLLMHGLTHHARREILANRETDYTEVVKLITETEADGFTFQKHIAKNVLPEYGHDWLLRLSNIFLIREPVEIVASYARINGQVSRHDVGMDRLAEIFHIAWSLAGEQPMVVESTDLLSNPKEIITRMCDYYELPFQDSMLTWEPDLSNSDLMMGGALEGLAEPWQNTLVNSSGFEAPTKVTPELSSELSDLAEQVQPAYLSLKQYAISLD